MTDSRTATRDAEPTPAESASAASAVSASEQGTDPRTRFVIPLLLVSAFVVILNETIMGVALPALNQDLGIPLATGQWLTTAFMLVMAVVIPITGFLLQRFHVRQVFMAAMILFSLGTLLCFLAPGFEILLLGRIVQASGTAIMMPLLMTTVLNMVPPERRGRTMGNISIVISVAPAVGPTVSGLILQVFEWRWMFGFVLPIALVALVLGALFIKNVTEPRQAKIDVLSVILSAFAFGGLVYGFSGLGESSATAVMPAFVPILVGVLALAAFIWRQISRQKTDSALLDLRVFTSRQFTVSLVLLAVSFMSLFGTIILLPIYMQEVLGYDTLRAGLTLLPGGLTMGLLAPFVGRLFDKLGTKPLIIPGSIIVSAAIWGMTMLTENSEQWMVIAAHVTLSVGLALMFTPLMTSALGDLPRSRYSHGSAVVSTAQQLAGAAGTAMFVVVMANSTVAAAGEGFGPIAAEAQGIHAAFLVGACISIVTIIGAFFVKAPAKREGAEAPAMH
ncbi:MDR family MFS transporter [Pseudoclavibacter sp. RFBA6]|uniref:MDR family MFS transporter n=1 Tax=Pseudoclavibacter sp. RFBA6 TaxID=2080573 RepID=UPI000CE7D2B8|nr:MDR family MFS transporter [Pseudoclavibacter sp. RFBA6]PPG40462.1 MFS transporter [Pseudoclavibacter sp. RFBA6]